jgi:cytochrome o ubiquinol oxidase operon protein cyoD
MSHKLPQAASEDHVTLSSYIAGFVLSLATTIAAYVVVTEKLYSKNGIIAAIAILAVAQFIVQMLFFMHLGQEKKPRWKLLALVFMTGVVMIIVLGSLWIMNHLDYNMMSSKQMQQYMDSQDGL